VNVGFTLRVLTIVNIRSGGSDAGLYDFVRALGEQGVEAVMRFAGPTQRIQDLTQDAEDFDRVVAAGGDGTVSAICYATRGTGVPVLAYPAGTANLLAMNLGLPLDAASLARTTLSGVPVAFDLGELTHPRADGPAEVSGFAVMAGAGYDAAIMETAAPLKATFGAAAYLLAAVGNIAPTAAEFELVLDGKTVSNDGIAVLLVNFGRLQFDIALSSGWDARDGLLDVAVVRRKSTVGLLPMVLGAMIDKTGQLTDRSSGIEVYQAAHVEVRSDPPLRMQYDGEVLDEMTPFSAHSLPRAATLIVPEGSAYATEAEAG